MQHRLRSAAAEGLSHDMGRRIIVCHFVTCGEPWHDNRLPATDEK